MITKARPMDEVFVTKREYRLLQARVKELEQLVKRQGEGFKTKATPAARTKVVETRNEAGCCTGDIVKVQWDKECFSRKQGKHEGKEAEAFAATPKFVKLRFDDGDTKSKRNHNVELVKAKHNTVTCKDGNGKQQTRTNSTGGS